MAKKNYSVNVTITDHNWDGDKYVDSQTVYSFKSRWYWLMRVKTFVGMLAHPRDFKCVMDAIKIVA